MKLLVAVAIILFGLVSLALMSSKTETEHSNDKAQTQQSYNPALDAVISQKK